MIPRTLLAVMFAVAILMSASATASGEGLVKQATLIPRDEVIKPGGEELALPPAVALSSDGNTALIGLPEADGEVGEARVFVRSGSTWTMQANLTGGGEVGAGRFGRSVALSPDGTTALIGGPWDKEGVGAAWVFTRTGSTWTERGPKLTGPGEVGKGGFGRSAALSLAGKTALIGGPWDNGSGAAWVFKRKGSRWRSQGEKLTGGGEQKVLEKGLGELLPVDGAFGEDVALSADGNTALIGGPHDELLFQPDWPYLGAAWFFSRTGSTWTQQGQKLLSPEKGPLGASVALAADGETALIGAYNLWPDYGSHLKGAFAFTRSRSAWTQEGPRLPACQTETECEKFEDKFRATGASVALSPDGGTALIGGWLVDVFKRAGSAWIQQGQPLACELAVRTRTEYDLCNVAVSGDGSTALLGTTVFVSEPPPEGSASKGSTRRSRTAGHKTSGGS